MRLFPWNRVWSTRISPWFPDVWFGEVEMKFREVDVGPPTFANGINVWYFCTAGSNRLCGMILPGNGSAMTIPLGPRRHVCGSKMGVEPEKSPRRNGSGATSRSDEPAA